MNKRWLASVVSGLLVVAPMAATAAVQAGQAPSDDQTSVTGDQTTVTEDASEDVEPDDVETPSPKATETKTPDRDEPSQEASENNEHGEIVSTVAKCAPTGRDFRQASGIGDFRNHGDIVKRVAQGETLSFEGKTYDLSTPEGAQSFCQALEAFVVAHPTPSPTASSTHGPESRPSKARDQKVESDEPEAEQTETEAPDHESGDVEAGQHGQPGKSGQSKGKGH